MEAGKGKERRGRKRKEGSKRNYRQSQPVPLNVNTEFILS